MGIPRGTTPTVTLTFGQNSGVDLLQAKNVYVSFQSSLSGLITKTGEDLALEERSVSVYLTQEETLSFRSGDVRVQINWTMEDGSRFASDIVTIAFDQQLLQAVIE